ncbi:unnamed protein product [marine sediment metagenome]|uniref:Uncharacterized protein n=1 Tax=marine sediment metagenome TaxID=412755 RepID=X1FBM8_9ZZZZ
MNGACTRAELTLFISNMEYEKLIILNAKDAYRVFKFVREMQ